MQHKFGPSSCSQLKRQQDLGWASDLNAVSWEFGRSSVGKLQTWAPWLHKVRIHVSFTCHLRHNSPFVLFTLNPTICSECQPWSESRLFSGDLALARRQSLHLCAENLSPVIIVPYNTKYIQHHWMWCSKILKKIPHCISHHHHWHSLIWIKHHKSKHCVFSNSTLATNIWLGHSAFAGSQQFKHDEGPKTTETGNKKQALLQRFVKHAQKYSKNWAVLLTMRLIFDPSYWLWCRAKSKMTTVELYWMSKIPALPGFQYEVGRRWW